MERELCLVDYLVALSVAGIWNGVILFVYDLCNDVVGSSDYVGPNSRVVNEW
jgi:hypothetical protein